MFGIILNPLHILLHLIFTTLLWSSYDYCLHFVSGENAAPRKQVTYLRWSQGLGQEIGPHGANSWVTWSLDWRTRLAVRSYKKYLQDINAYFWKMGLWVIHIFLFSLSVYSNFSIRNINFHKEGAEILVLITHSLHSFPVDREEDDWSKKHSYFHLYIKRKITQRKPKYFKYLLPNLRRKDAHHSVFQGSLSGQRHRWSRWGVRGRSEKDTWFSSVMS